MWRFKKSMFAWLTGFKEPLIHTPESLFLQIVNSADYKNAYRAEYTYVVEEYQFIPGGKVIDIYYRRTYVGHVPIKFKKLLDIKFHEQEQRMQRHKHLVENMCDAPQRLKEMKNATDH